MKTPKCTKSRRGRKPGTKNKLTESGVDFFENLGRAHWGAGWGTLGGALAHQEWIARHPSADNLKRRQEAHGANPVEIVAEAQAQPIGEPLASNIIAAIDRRDWKFFSDMAQALRLLNTDGTIHSVEPREAALLAYVDGEMSEKPGRKFTLAELRDDVPWGRDERGPLAPSTRMLERMVAAFSVPMHRGRPLRK